ncbi:MAG: biotin transporter BioY [Anaeroplasmataceae bacterium]|nr:biotin transporter BioY [Anaeroplasmataceae bacterium]
MKIQDLAYMGISLALVVICSRITFQFGPIPITLQTFAVVFVGSFLKTKKAVIVFLCYILMGLAGLPVFSGGGGPAYVLLPSFGFIIGFLASVFVTGAKAFQKYKISVFVKSVLGILVIHLFGLLHMILIFNLYKHMNISLIYVVEIGSLPFLLKDFISSLLASLICIRLSKVFLVEPVRNYNIEYGKERKNNV